MSERASEPRVTTNRWTPWVAGLAVTTVLAVAVGGVAAARPTAALAPTSVFEESRSLAIDAARARLRLFVADNPENTAGGVPADAPECPLSSADALALVGTQVGASGDVDLRLEPNPWEGRTTSDPELRPNTVPTGEVGGIPIVRCDAAPVADPAATRPALFAISLTGGVSFDDVVRLYNLEGLLRSSPADIGGEMVGSCLGSDDTGVCVVLWQSRGLVLGLTLEGPPAAVNSSTAGATLATAVPVVVDTLAVVLGPAPACTADAIGASTGVVLFGEPECRGGWAFGVTAPCESDLGCEEDPIEVFHIDPDGWVHDGLVAVDCTENLTRLGMTVATASQFAPTPCDDDDPSLATGSIGPGSEGTRVAAVQVGLVSVGYDLPVDGQYGPLTAAAVVDFQERNGLTVDGVAGPQTRAALGI